MAEIGSIIDGKYEILTELGHGGMSVVYLAMDRRLKKQWAVKEAKKKPPGQSNIVGLTPVSEAEMLTKLNHPNIVRIVDIVDQNDTIYIIEDFVEGKSLAEEVKHGPSTPEDVVLWGSQLCDVLEYLHTRSPKIIYRDMKPANVQLLPDRQQIKLLDFGIAKKYKPQNVGDTTNVGTRGYAAPEQFDAKVQSDARTDVYSLGITLRSLLMGKTPYDVEFYDDIRKQNPAVTDGLIKVLNKATAQNPANRYQSAADFKYALQHYHDRDEAVIRIRQRKLNAFRGLIAAAISFFMIGAILMPLSFVVRNHDYQDKLSSGKYEECIAIDPTRADAYQGYVESASANQLATLPDYIGQYTQIKDTEDRNAVGFEIALRVELNSNLDKKDALDNACKYYRSFASTDPDSIRILPNQPFDIKNGLESVDIPASIATIKLYYAQIYQAVANYSNDPDANGAAKNLDEVMKNLQTIRSFLEENKDQLAAYDALYNSANTSDAECQGIYDFMVKSQANCLIDNKAYFLPKRAAALQCFFDDSISQKAKQNFKENT